MTINGREQVSVLENPAALTCSLKPDQSECRNENRIYLPIS